jgi:hypothetical protein
VLAWLVVAPVASAREWVGTPANVSGQTVLSRGELVYTDWLYDDYGPNLDGVPNGPPEQEMGGFNPTEGDYRYPDEPDRYGYNAADLRELRIAADDQGLHLRISLETLKAPDAAIATLAIDGDPTSIPAAGCS